VLVISLFLLSVSQSLRWFVSVTSPPLTLGYPPRLPIASSCTVVSTWITDFESRRPPSNVYMCLFEHVIPLHVTSAALLQDLFPPPFFFQNYCFDQGEYLRYAVLCVIATLEIMGMSIETPPSLLLFVFCTPPPSTNGGVRSSLLLSDHVDINSIVLLLPFVPFMDRLLLGSIRFVFVFVSMLCSWITNAVVPLLVYPVTDSERRSVGLLAFGHRLFAGIRRWLAHTHIANVIGNRALHALNTQT